jgi:hypothetical protein
MSSSLLLFEAILAEDEERVKDLLLLPLHSVGEITGPIDINERDMVRKRRNTLYCTVVTLRVGCLNIDSICRVTRLL